MKKRKRLARFRKQDKGKFGPNYDPRAHQITRKEWEARLKAGSVKILPCISGKV